MFNLFTFADVTIGLAGINTETIYGLGIDATGSPAPRHTDANGPTDTNNFRIGTSLQSQFGVRFLFLNRGRPTL